MFSLNAQTNFFRPIFESPVAVMTDDLQLASLVETAWTQTVSLLREFIQQPDSSEQLRISFGETIADERKPLNPPPIALLNSTQLQGAIGAYAAQTNQIFLSQEFVTANVDNPSAIAAVLLEELGHAIDAQINETDSAGDEGAIFSALVRGESLSEEALAALKAEDDSAVITIDGEEILIEQLTFTVSNTNDSGAGSLRQAIIEANNNAGADTIEFAIPSGSTITLSSGELSITDELTIDGDLDDDGTPDITVDADGNSRVFDINDGTGSAIDVSIDGLTISGGTASDDGAGIFNRENLTLTNSTLTGNSAGDGGGDTLTLITNFSF